MMDTYSADTMQGPPCRCDWPSKTFTVQKLGPNNGRTFFACPKNKEDPTKCNYFRWTDESEEQRQQRIKRPRTQASSPPQPHNDSYPGFQNALDRHKMQQGIQQSIMNENLLQSINDRVKAIEESCANMCSLMSDVILINQDLLETVQRNPALLRPTTSTLKRKRPSPARVCEEDEETQLPE